MVGEIDITTPFQSVKAAVGLFGEAAFSGRSPSKKTKSSSADRLLAKETHFHWAQVELSKLKEQVRNAETLKVQALAELDVAHQTVNELTHKLKVVIDSKDLATKATEPKFEVEVASNGVTKGYDGSMKVGLEAEREKYYEAITELDSEKQVRRSIRQDYDASSTKMTTAIDQVAEAEHTSTGNIYRVDELSREIAAVQESISQVKLATNQMQEEEEHICNEKNAQKQLHKASLEDSANKLLSLKRKFDPELFRNIENELEATMSDIEALQKQIDYTKTSDLDFVKIDSSELDGVKESLHTVTEEKSSLHDLVEQLKEEIENVKKEHSELKENDAETTVYIAGSLHVKLQKAKRVLELVLAGEEKVRGSSKEMNSILHQLIKESEDAKHGAEEMKKKAEELKRESESTKTILEEAEKILRDATEEAEEAKAAETRALGRIKILSVRRNAARASTSESGANIQISREELESLSRSVEEAANLAERRVTAAMAVVEAVKASEKETMKRLEVLQQEIDKMTAATLYALKKAEMAEAANRAAECELRRWGEREQKKAASRIMAETEVSLDSPQNYRIQIQNQPARKSEKATFISSPQMYSTQKYNLRVIKPELRKLEKSKTSMAKKALMQNLSGIFHRRNLVGCSSPSCSPGEWSS